MIKLNIYLDIMYYMYNNLTNILIVGLNKYFKNRKMYLLKYKLYYSYILTNLFEKLEIFDLLSAKC